MKSSKKLNISKSITFLAFFSGLTLLFIGFPGHSLIIILSLALLFFIHAVFGLKLVSKNFKSKSWIFYQGTVIFLIGICYLDIIYFYVFEGLPNSNFGLVSGSSLFLNLVFIGFGLINNQQQNILKPLGFKYLNSFIFTIIICSTFFFFKKNYHVTYFFKDKAYYYQHESTQLINEEQYSEAKKYALKSLKIGNIDEVTKAFSYKNLGVICTIEGDFIKSDSLFDLSYTLMKNSSNKRKSYYIKDIKSRQLQNVQKRKSQSEIDRYTLITSIDTENEEAFNKLGAAYHDLKKYDMAIKNYTKAIQLNPNFVRAYGNRGISRNNIGDKKGAISDYSKALELDSSYANAYINRGYTYRNLGEYEKAIKDFKKAHDLNPKNEKAVGNLIMVYRKVGNCEKIVKWCNYHIGHFPERDTVYKIKQDCIKKNK